MIDPSHTPRALYDRTHSKALPFSPRDSNWMPRCKVPTFGLVPLLPMVLEKISCVEFCVVVWQPLTAFTNFTTSVVSPGRFTVTKLEILTARYRDTAARYSLCGPSAGSGPSITYYNTDSPSLGLALGLFWFCEMARAWVGCCIVICLRGC